MSEFLTYARLQEFKRDNCRSCHFGKVGKIRSGWGRFQDFFKPFCSFPTPPKIDENVEKCLSRVKRLTPREIEILRLLRDGLEDREIALRLGIPHESTKNHERRIRRKLSTANRTNTVVKALRLKIIHLEGE